MFTNTDSNNGNLVFLFNLLIRYLTESGDHYLRKSNESLQIVKCDLSQNLAEAVYVDSPHWNLAQDNISEIAIVINSTLITDNGRGILQFSR